MGKKRNEIKVIDSKKSRKDTFHKRKFGLLKKASELSMLCNLKLLLFFEDLTGKLIQYSSQGNYDPTDYFELNKRKRTIIRFTANDYPDFFHKPGGSRMQVKQEGEEDDNEDMIDEPGEEDDHLAIKMEHQPNQIILENKQNLEAQAGILGSGDPAQISQEIENINRRVENVKMTLKSKQCSSNTSEIEAISSQLTHLLTQLNTLSQQTNNQKGPNEGLVEKFAVPQSGSKLSISPDKRGPIGMQRARNIDTQSPGIGAFRRDLDMMALEDHKEGFNKSPNDFSKFSGENDDQFNVNINFLLSKPSDLPYAAFPQSITRPGNDKMEQVSRQSSNLSNYWTQYKNDQPSRQSSEGFSQYLSREDLTRPANNEKLQKGTRDYWTKYGRIDSGMSDILKQDSMADFFHPQKGDERMLDDVLGRELLKKGGKPELANEYPDLKLFEQLQLEDTNRYTQDLGQYEKVNTSTERREQSFMLFSPLPLSSMALGQQKPQPNTGSDWMSQYYQSLNNQTGSLNPAFRAFDPNMTLNLSNLSDNSIMKSPRLEKKVRDNQ
mgnify:FL=1